MAKVIFGEFRLMLYPKNFTAVRKFYEEILGCKVTHQWNEGEDDRGVMFEVGNTTLELLGRRGKYQPVAGCELSIEVEDVARLWEAFEGKEGVVFGLRENEWGDTSFCITDPEGLKITFFSKHENSSET